MQILTLETYQLGTRLGETVRYQAAVSSVW
jgi:hypothetical protein